MADLASLVLRVVVGAIFLGQGHTKLFRPPDEPQGRERLAAAIAAAGFPFAARLALLVAAVEAFFGTLLLLGFQTRLATVPLTALLVVAIARVRWQKGFVNGWDWPLSVLGGTIALLLLGSGAYSLDALLGLPW